MNNDTKPLLNLLAQAIYDKKGFNITALDVKKISTMTSYVIIAEGSSERHVQSLARTVIDVMRERKERALHVEGDRNGDWVVVDCWDVVVHIFAPGLREKYKLEMLWHEAPIVDLDITMKQEG